MPLPPDCWRTRYNSRYPICLVIHPLVRSFVLSDVVTILEIKGQGHSSYFYIIYTCCMLLWSSCSRGVQILLV